MLFASEEKIKKEMNRLKDDTGPKWNYRPLFIMGPFIILHFFYYPIYGMMPYYLGGALMLLAELTIGRASWVALFRALKEKEKNGILAVKENRCRYCSHCEGSDCAEADYVWIYGDVGYYTPGKNCSYKGELL